MQASEAVLATDWQPLAGVLTTLHCESLYESALQIKSEKLLGGRVKDSTLLKGAKVTQLLLAVTWIAVLLTTGCATTEQKQNLRELKALAEQVDMTQLNDDDTEFLEEYKTRKFSDDERADTQQMFGVDPETLSDAELIALHRALKAIPPVPN